jgi:hypothetical protein
MKERDVFNVFVGTMYSGENEFDCSQQFIDDQKNVFVSKYIVKNKSEHKAAKELYSTWNIVKDEYDFFVQVDADTILAHDLVFDHATKALYAYLAPLRDNTKTFTSLQAPLFDYLTNDYVMGLNVYSTQVEWDVKIDNLYTDRCTKNNKTMRPDNFEDFPKSLIPAGSHATMLSNVQAYHYGVHRGLKRQFDKRDKIRATLKSLPRMFALAGFDDCEKFRGTIEFNYGDDKFLKAFEEANKRITSF